ncbi:MAG: leucyl aminopeptidase, partial [Gammaproteobacteria bacterium]|nr:leucyl aminopeptidase [Gammaproteobacteria bacterium]
MQYFVTTNSPATHLTDCIVVAVFEQGELSPGAGIIDLQSNGYIKKIIERGDISGKAGQTLLLQDVANITSPRVLLVGCGKKEKTTENDFNKAITAVAQLLNESGCTDASSCLTEVVINTRTTSWKVRQSMITTETALYKYTQTKSDAKPQLNPLARLGFFAQDNEAAELEQAAQTGQAIANGMNLARELGNLPGNICTPTYIADQAVELGKRFDSVTTTVLEEADMAELKMGSFLSVSRGSREPAKLITMNYKGAGDERPVVLVGKGLTFDAGGISLKPSQGMDEMKYDMCGSASVLGTIAAIAELNLPINVVGVVPSSENLPDGDANKPGDIVTSMAGKTIEILN